MSQEAPPVRKNARGSVTDTVGGVMYVEYKNGEVRECQK